MWLNPIIQIQISQAIGKIGSKNVKFLLHHLIEGKLYNFGCWCIQSCVAQNSLIGAVPTIIPVWEHFSSHRRVSRAF